MRSQRGSYSERGQALIEMAFAALVLVILLMGLVDLGRLFFTYVALEDGAGEAALFLAMEPACRDSSDLRPNGSHCDDPNNALYHAVNAGGGLVDWSSGTVTGTVTIDRPTPYSLGDTITVTIEYPFQLLTPLVSGMVGDDSLVLTGQAQQTILGSY